MTRKQSVKKETDHLDTVDLRRAADYLAFLRFRSRVRPPLPDEATLAASYAQSSEEDRQLAEAGIDEFALLPAAEDAA